MLPYIKKLRVEVGLLLLINTLLTILALMNPKIFQFLIDEVMIKRNSSKFIYVIISLLSIYVSKAIIEGLQLKTTNRTLNVFSLTMRQAMWKKLSAMPNSKVSRYEYGDLKMRFIDDINDLGDLINRLIVEYAFSVFMVFAVLGVVIYIHPLLSAVCLAILPIVFFINHLLGKKSNAFNSEQRESREKYYTEAHNSLQYWKEIKCNSGEEVFVERIKKHRRILAKLGYKGIRYWSFWEIFNDFKANYLTKALVYIIGAIFVWEGEISVGELVMFGEYFALLFTALDTISFKQAYLNMNLPYFNRVFEVLNYTEALDKKKIVEINTIEFKNASFKYDAKDSWVTDKLTHIFPKGKTTAIVGENGSGKTTLLKLLLGLHFPQNGEVIINNTSTEDMDVSSYYKHIGVVMQDSYFFNETIKDNLLMSNPTATDGEIWKAVMAVNLDSFIENLENGIDTIVGEKGIKLSGGQRQRLAIARAMLRNPDTIILDECTSAVDGMNEAHIIRNIKNLFPKATVILISHKPAQVKNADIILVMDSGKTVAKGEHKKLLQENSFYRKLCNN